MEHYRDRIGYGFVKEQMECVKEWLDAGVEYEIIKAAIDEARGGVGGSEEVFIYQSDSRR